jgi:integrin alpha 8
MEAYTVFGSENKLISLDNKNCSLSNRQKVTCTTVSSCLKYNGINLPATIDIEVSWVLDSKKSQTPRMYFINDEDKNIRNSTMRLQRGKEECRQELVYIKDGVRDKLTPLEVEMKYSIRQATTTYSASNVSRRRRTTTLDPVVDENRGTVQRDSINIMKNCGKDNICIPDLKLDVKTDDKYLLGANESLIVEVLITNSGEDAFEANYYMTVPQGLDYKVTKKIGASQDKSFICTAPSPATDNVLKCDLGNPMPRGTSVNFKVFMEPTKQGGKTSVYPFYEFHMEANSTNEEAEGSNFDNILKKSIAIFVESDLAISGSSTPSELHYNVSQYKEFKNALNESEIGPHVVHKYDIRNNGTSTIEEIEIFINWPAETLDDEPLMYLMNQPETSGNVVCDQTQFVNQYGLQRDHALERKSFLDTGRAPIRQGEFGFSSGSGYKRYNNQGGFEDSREEGSNKNSSYFESSQSNRGHNVHSSSGTRINVNWEDSNARNEDSLVTRYMGNSQKGSSGSSTHTQSGSSSSSERTFSQGGSSGSSDRTFSQGGSSGSSDRTFTQGGSSRGNSRDESNTYDFGDNWAGRFLGGSQSGSSGSSTQGGSSRGSSRDESHYRETSGNNRIDLDGTYGSGVSGGNVREYHEEWNSTSVNGGPAVVHHASKNKTIVRGQGGQVHVSEVSTERTYTGSIGEGRWDERDSRQGSRYEDSRVSQSQRDYERQQREYYENQRRYQEEQRQQQINERRRQQEAQRRDEEERIRLDEERRRIDDERRRLQYEQSRSRSSGGSSYESNYDRNSESSRSNSGSSSRGSSR